MQKYINVLRIDLKTAQKICWDILLQKLFSNWITLIFSIEKYIWCHKMAQLNLVKQDSGSSKLNTVFVEIFNASSYVSRTRTITITKACISHVIFPFYLFGTFVIGPSFCDFFPFFGGANISSWCMVFIKLSITVALILAYQYHGHYVSSVMIIFCNTHSVPLYSEIFLLHWMYWLPSTFEWTKELYTFTL